MSTCPNGHQSGSGDWCDVCGLRITGAAGPVGMSPGGQGSPPPGAPGGYGYPQQSPPAPYGADSGVSGEFCPQCRMPRRPGAAFCGQCRHSFAPPAGGGYMPPPPSGAVPHLPPGFQQQQPQAAPGFDPNAAPGGRSADVHTPQPVPPQGLYQQPPQGMPQPPHGQHPQPPHAPPQPPHASQAPHGQHPSPPHAPQAAPPPQAPPQYQQQYQQQPMPGSPPPYGQGDDWQLRPPGPVPGQAQDDGRFAAQPPQGQQQPPVGSEQGAPPAGWTAIIATDPEYFNAMMRRSGPDASALNMPSASPEQRLPLSGQQIVIGRHRNSTGESPDIDLSLPPEDPGVSHQHAVLVSRPDGTWAVMDKDSTNGTTLNLAEEPIPPFVQIPLRDGDRVHVGAWTTITVQRG